MIHPFISGNKWRKLKFNLQKAKQQGKQRLITFGGAWSNHLIATACAGTTFGFETTAYVRGDAIRNPVLDMCQLFGMKLHFLSREDYRHRETLWHTLTADPANYLVDEGGLGHEATLGCQEIIAELNHEYQHVFCAAGTGTTAAGIAQALAEKSPNTKLHIVPVLKGGGFILDEMEKLNAPLRQTILHTDYHFGGYAKTKPALLQFVKDFVAQTGIMIEPTYTGKALFAMHDLLNKNVFSPRERILFVHTGGLTGLLGMLGRFDF
jgi:1-aminocyclopropane-1-carboxylate deaminase